MFFDFFTTAPNEMLALEVGPGPERRPDGAKRYLKTHLKTHQVLQRIEDLKKSTKTSNKNDSEPCVLTVKVGPEVLRLAQERHDPHDHRSLCTKAFGTNPFRVTVADPCA